ncbi:hypothetical protein [Intrasporangium sp. YIM S08009]|uniref:hypothetical protein n=1 Tax=Intrasporangium zincisolvens TaxID=3080018 RepID=UPI002B05D16A|nr:hypothetical protein [Intrasporangium sp. YIM S08009]
MEHPGEQLSQIDSWDRLVAVPTAFGPQLESLLRALLEQRQISVHSVTHRVKTQASAEKKLSARSDRYAGLGDLHDILGLRIITYFSDQVDIAADLIRAEFSIDHSESANKGDALAPDRFGYRSQHFVGTLGKARASLAEYTRFAECRFEVQVRSILQHAWAEVEHDLGYKSPVSVSAHTRRRFSRLAGMFEIADDEFVAIREEIARHIAEVNQAIGQGETNLPLDREALVAYMSKDGTLTSLDMRIMTAKAVAPEPLSPAYAEWRIPELQQLGIENVADLQALLTRDGDDVVALAVGWLTFSNSHDPEMQELRDLDDDSMREVLDFASNELNEFEEDDLMPSGWDPVAKRWRSLPRGISLFYLHKLARLRAEHGVDPLDEDESSALRQALELGRAALR